VEFFTDFNCGKQFPALLREAGLIVHMHVDHFEQDAEDVEWAPAIAERGWVGISRIGKSRVRQWSTMR
jgi:PIN like domain